MSHPNNPFLIFAVGAMLLAICKIVHLGALGTSPISRDFIGFDGAEFGYRRLCKSEMLHENVRGEMVYEGVENVILGLMGYTAAWDMNNRNENVRVIPF